MALVSLALMVVACGPNLDGTSGTVSAPSPPDVFAHAGPVPVHLPSPQTIVVGFHESNNGGAQQMVGVDSQSPALTMGSRGRGTGSRTAADVALPQNVVVTAPVTGTVVRASTYWLYCSTIDELVVIAPDDAPTWEVKVLHIQGLRVDVGDRVIGGLTEIADRSRLLAGVSQVDSHYPGPRGPHVHIEIVNPRLPDRRGRSC